MKGAALVGLTAVCSSVLCVACVRLNAAFPGLWRRVNASQIHQELVRGVKELGYVRP